MRWGIPVIPNQHHNNLRIFPLTGSQMLHRALGLAAVEGYWFGCLWALPDWAKKGKLFWVHWVHVWYVLLDFKMARFDPNKNSLWQHVAFWWSILLRSADNMNNTFNEEKHHQFASFICLLSASPQSSTNRDTLNTFLIGFLSYRSLLSPQFNIINLHQAVRDNWLAVQLS